MSDSAAPPVDLTCDLVTIRKPDKYPAMPERRTRRTLFSRPPLPMLAQAGPVSRIAAQRRRAAKRAREDRISQEICELLRVVNEEVKAIGVHADRLAQAVRDLREDLQAAEDRTSQAMQDVRQSVEQARADMGKSVVWLTWGITRTMFGGVEPLHEVCSVGDDTAIGRRPRACHTDEDHFALTWRGCSAVTPLGCSSLVSTHPSLVSFTVAFHFTLHQHLTDS